MADPSLFDAIAEVRRRSAEAVVARSGLNHAGLSAEIRRRFSSEDPAIGGVIQEPVIEVAAPYLSADVTMQELAGDFLTDALVDVLDGAGDKRERVYRFRRQWRPYLHQLNAWRALKEATSQSVLITSGTGSGKTECFFLPILDDLIRQSQETRLEGVQAIFLYPLNALIASQEERLREWTGPFAPRIRFALYNGLLREEDSSDVARGRPETVCDRKTLRASPPPMLVTNVTMLEYMLLRKADAPILAASQGKLRYIVLDEAHSYVGTQAAEIALLLRRVCLAFGVSPANVRFIATSATIGGPDKEDSLHKFLCDVSGASPQSVRVITGDTRKPVWPALGSPKRLTATELSSEDPEFLYNTLAANPGVRPILDKLREGPVHLSVFEVQAQKLGVTGASLATAIGAAQKGDDTLGPLRVHVFHRAIPGIWTCLDPACTSPRPEKWPFGALQTHDAERCTCGAPTFEIVACGDCGEPFVFLEEKPNGDLARPMRSVVADEFAADADIDAAPAVDDIEEGSEEWILEASSTRRRLAVRSLPRSVKLFIEPKRGRVEGDGRTEGVITANAVDDEPQCPACHASRRAGAQPLIRPLRFGAPFVLGNAAPVLLAAASKAESVANPEEPRAPSDGRQLLTFTDSRQGTARFAAKLQIGAERDFVRSFVYHAVQDALRRSRTSNELHELETQIASLDSLIGSNPALIPVLETLKQKRVALVLGTAGNSALPWNDMVARLSEQPEVNTWITAVWRSREQRFENPPALATFLLLREFLRRPKRANALETLGLACLRFPAIEKLAAVHVPSSFMRIGGKHEDWKDFLNLLLTYLVRANGAVRVDPSDRHWVQPRGPAKSYVRAALGQAKGRNELNWPSLSARSAFRPARPIILLAQAFNLSLDDSQARESIAECMNAAWVALQNILVGPGSTSAALTFGYSVVAPLTTAWICPITRRLLDVTLRGLSPYGADKVGSIGAVAAKVQMPYLPTPFLGRIDGRDPVEGRKEIADWLESDSCVRDLRLRDCWGDIGDRTALFSEYFRSAEHSAQQPPARLRRYEELFRKGLINILNCSTTMEMGVDIGSVSAILMTNVPPSIANYRQRIGRAGRRKQPISMGFTFCKDRPFDRDAFANPIRFLRRDARAPRVVLDSRVVVQRHVNALLFARYTIDHRDDAIKLQAGPFFGCPSGPAAKEVADSPAALFVDWLRRPTTKGEISPAIRALVRGSSLESDPSLIEEAALALEHVRERFAQEWRALQAVLAERNPNDRAATLGLEIQVKRLCEDYLLSALSSRGFLPSHGFPTAVVSFVTPGDARGDLGSEEGNRFKSYPQRSRDIAIREYAPGAEVVLDGLVYTSAGVTLNWKRPASPDDVVREIQNLLQRWTCPTCGEAETARHGVAPGGACPACGAAGVMTFKVLEPAGFRADFRLPAHADSDQVNFIPSAPPHVSARGGMWTSLLDPTRGRHRVNREGSVFFCTTGPDKYGYDVCLHCGRAEPSNPDRAPGERWDHSPLLGRPDPDGYCPGSAKPFAIQRQLRLAHEVTTDVFELQVYGSTTIGAGLALSSALREALARELGIEPDELGIGVAPRADARGSKSVSIFLFDRAAGGAGFSAQASDHLPDLLSLAKEILNCPAQGCVHGCPACVLTADMSEEEARVLDRQAALSVVRELAAEARPEERDRVTPDTRLVTKLHDELDVAVRAGMRDVLLRASAPLDVAGLREMTAPLDALRAHGARLNLQIPEGALEPLDGASCLALRDCLSRLDADLYEAPSTVLANGARMIAQASAPGSALVFATADQAAFNLGDSWGRPVERPLVRFDSTQAFLAGRLIHRDSLQPSPGAALKEVGQDLNGALSVFGERTAALVRALLAEIGVVRSEIIIKVTYEDRYLRSPLAVRLCIDTLSALLKSSKPIPQVVISTRPLPPDARSPRRIEHDWRRQDDRTDVISAYGRARGIPITFHEANNDHARRLLLEYGDGRKVQVLLDQGFGAWRPQRPKEFDFLAAPSAQARQLRGIDTEIGITGDRTWIVASEIE